MKTPQHIASELLESVARTNPNDLSIINPLEELVKALGGPTATKTAASLSSLDEAIRKARSGGGPSKIVSFPPKPSSSLDEAIRKARGGHKTLTSSQPKSSSSLDEAIRKARAKR